MSGKKPTCPAGFEFIGITDEDLAEGAPINVAESSIKRIVDVAPNIVHSKGAIHVYKFVGTIYVEPSVEYEGEDV